MTVDHENKNKENKIFHMSTLDFGSSVLLKDDNKNPQTNLKSGESPIRFKAEKELFENGLVFQSLKTKSEININIPRDSIRKNQTHEDINYLVKSSENRENSPHTLEDKTSNGDSIFVDKQLLNSKSTSIQSEEKKESGKNSIKTTNYINMSELLGHKSDNLFKSSKSWFQKKESIFGENTKKSKEENLLNTLKMRYEIIYQEFKDEKFSQRNFIFLDFIRQTLFLTVIICLFNDPLLQIILVLVLQFFYLFAAGIIKPFALNYSKLNFVITEIFMSLALLSCVIIGFYDYFGIEEVHKRTRLGWIVPYCNLGLLYWMFFTMIFKIFAKIWQFIRSRKKVHIIEN